LRRCRERDYDWAVGKSNGSALFRPEGVPGVR
jgi:hypothetical protein